MTESFLNVDEILGKYHVFLTGASGFIGMAILHKLLQISHPPSFSVDSDDNNNDHRIYCLLRKSKQYETVNDRMKEEIFKNSLFSEYSSDQIQYLFSKQKVIGIEGELTKPLLGVNEKQYNQLEYASKEGIYVIHCAADIQFNNPFNDAMNINVNGTYQCLELAKKLNIPYFVHISTLYVNCREGRDVRVMEKIYDQGFDGANIFDEWISQNHHLSDNYVAENVLCKKDINNTEQRINWPNTYALTKNIAEQVAFRYCQQNNMHLAIARLGIVSPVAKGKQEGWFVGSGGFVLVSIGTGQGHIRYFKGDGKGRVDIVPADYTVNAILGMSADLIYNSNHNNDCKIYNIGITAKQNDDWGLASMLAYCIPRFQEKQLPGADKAIGVKYIENETLFYLIELFKYDIPLFFVSFLLYVPLIQKIFSLTFWFNIITTICSYFNGNIGDSDNLKHVDNEIAAIEQQLNEKQSKLTKKVTFLLKARKKLKEFTQCYSYFLNQRWRFDYSKVTALYLKLDKESRAKYDFDINAINVDEYALNNSILVMNQYYQKQQLRKKEEALKEEKMRQRLKELKEKKIKQIRIDHYNDNDNNNKHSNEKKIWEIIQRLGINLGGIGVYNFCISLVFTLGLLWIAFSL